MEKPVPIAPVLSKEDGADTFKLIYRRNTDGSIYFREEMDAYVAWLESQIVEKPTHAAGYSV